MQDEQQMQWNKVNKGTLKLNVYIQPGAKKSQISGLYNKCLKIRLHAQAIEGQANKKLIVFLAKFLHIPKKYFTLHSGLRSRKKIILIEGLSEKEIKIVISKINVLCKF